MIPEPRGKIQLSFSFSLREARRAPEGVINQTMKGSVPAPWSCRALDPPTPHPKSLTQMSPFPNELQPLPGMAAVTPRTPLRLHPGPWKGIPLN